MSRMSTCACILALACCIVCAPARAAKAVSDIQLDNGLSLSDWLNSKSVSAAEPTLAVGTQAVDYVRRYGPYRELLEVVLRASNHAFDPTTINESNAAAMMREIDAARVALGDWPALLWSHARAAAFASDDTTLSVDLKSWLGVAPIGDERRPEIVDFMLKQTPNSKAFLLAFPSYVPLKQSLPPELAQFEPEIKAALKCLYQAGEDRPFKTTLRGTWDIGPLKGKPLDAVSHPTLLGNGIEQFISETHGSYESKTAVIKFGTIEWEYLHFDMPSLNNRGTEVESNRDIICDKPMFPLEAGRNGNIAFTHTRTLDATNSHQESLHTIHYRIGPSPLSAVDVMARYSHLSIDPAFTSGLKFYEVNVEDEVKWTVLSQLERGYLKNETKTDVLIYIEGLKTFIDPKFPKFSGLREDWRLEISPAP